jgi:hypothetical protein
MSQGYSAFGGFRAVATPGTDARPNRTPMGVPPRRGWCDHFEGRDRSNPCCRAWFSFFFFFPFLSSLRIRVFRVFRGPFRPSCHPYCNSPPCVREVVLSRSLLSMGFFFAPFASSRLFFLAIEKKFNRQGAKNAKKEKWGATEFRHAFPHWSQSVGSAFSANFSRR